jgi:hypothetical protein
MVPVTCARDMFSAAKLEMESANQSSRGPGFIDIYPSAHTLNSDHRFAVRQDRFRQQHSGVTFPVNQGYRQLMDDEFTMDVMRAAHPRLCSWLSPRQRRLAVDALKSVLSDMRPVVIKYVQPAELCSSPAKQHGQS